MTFSGSCSPTISFAHELAVGIVVESAEIDAEVFRQAVVIDVKLRGQRLVSVKRGKGLQLHQLGVESALVIANQSKVNGNKHRPRRLVGDVVFRRNRLVGHAQVLRISE